MYDAGSVVGRIVLNTRGWDTGYSNVMSGLRSMARSSIFYGAAAAVGIQKMTAEFGRFELEMRRATSVLDITEEQFATMSRAAENASIKWNLAATDAAKGFLYMGRAGMSVIQQMQAFEPILLASKSMMTNLGTTAEGIINTMNAFNITFDRTSEVVNIVSAAVNKSTQNLDDMLIALSYSAKPAQMMNNSLSELSAMLGLVANEGIRGSKAGTALRFALTALASPVADARVLIRELGLRTVDASGRVIPLITVLDQLKDRLSAASEETRDLVLETLFGRRAMPSMISLFQLGGDRIRAFERELRTTGDTAEAVATRQMKAFLEQIGRMWRELQSLTRHFVSSAIPTFTRWGNVIRDHVRYWRDWVDAHGAAVQSMVEMTFKAGALAIAFGALALVLPTFLNAIRALASIPVGIFKLFTSPLGWAASVAAALYVVRAAWNASFLGMNRTHQSFSAAVSDWLRSFALDFKVVFNWIGDNWELMLNDMFGVFGRIMVWIVWVLEKLGRIPVAMARSISGGIYEMMVGNWSEALRYITMNTDDAMKDIARTLSYDFKVTAEALPLIASKVADVIPGLFDVTVSQAKEDLGKLRSIVTTFLSGITDDLWKKTFGFLFGHLPTDFLRFMMELMNVRYGELKLPAPIYENAMPQRAAAAVHPFVETWRNAVKEVVGSVGTGFDSISTGLVRSMNDLVSGWTDSFDKLMSKGGSIKTFFDDLFQSMLSSLRRFLAQVAANSLFTAIFGGRKGFDIGKMDIWSLGDLLSPSSGGISIPYSQSPSVILHVTNTTPLPISLKQVGSSTSGRDAVISYVMEEAQSNPAFRDLMRGGY